MSVLSAFWGALKTSIGLPVVISEKIEDWTGNIFSKRIDDGFDPKMLALTQATFWSGVVSAALFFILYYTKTINPNELSNVWWIIAIPVLALIGMLTWDFIANMKHIDKLPFKLLYALYMLFIGAVFAVLGILFVVAVIYVVVILLAIFVLWALAKATIFNDNEYRIKTKDGTHLRQCDMMDPDKYTDDLGHTYKRDGDKVTQID